MRALKAWVTILLLASWPSHAQTAAPKTSRSCASPEHRQFDFWVGDWDAFDVDAPGKVVARNHVDVILDGCALREVYEQTNGLVGQSFSIYDASRKVWHQSWVTNRGQLLVVEGRFENDRMTLSGTQIVDGHPETLRAVWYPEKGGVRETAESSRDGGKTWKPVFDIVFRPHKGEAAHSTSSTLASPVRWPSSPRPSSPRLPPT